MAKLQLIDRKKLEDYLMMGGGYVLDFSNRTFREFVADSTGKDIEDSKYYDGGDSKANRLRTFIKMETASVVSKLLKDLIDYRALIMTERMRTPLTDAETSLYQSCKVIVERITQEEPELVEWVEVATGDDDFEKLSTIIKELIDKSQPELALDRLHTFLVKFLRQIFEKHDISYNRDKPIHSYLGEYVKFLRQSNWIEADITERILKSSISVFEAFNDVRNNQSLAHDNKLLNFDESLLIFRHVSATINFMLSIERKIELSKTPAFTNILNFDDLPF